MGGQKANESLGQSLIKQRNAHKANKDQRHQQRKGAVESHIDVRDLDTVMEQAELAGRIFSSTHPLPEFLVRAESSEDEMLSPDEKQRKQREEEELHQSSLKIPRRPKWHAAMTPEELDTRERQSFLKWRREIARLEENEKLVVTPFEKNIDVWRQLWRVVERSHLVVTVVDARNPLFYRCPDLETYVHEIDPFKRTMLLVNKADLLPITARSKWSSYFKSQGISFLFWSAKNATAVLEGKGMLDNAYDGMVSVDDDTRVYGRDELLEKLEAEAEYVSRSRKEAASLASKAEQLNVEDDDGRSVGSPGHQHGASKHAVVGFVGYPNVGKSSTINALVGEKKTGVTSTPGKTKHFQTLIISETLMLCDCPGLVFPSFTSSRSDMVASGVLPIDRLTDHRGPVQVIANLVPRITLEELYGLSLPKPKPYEPQDRPPMAHELLHAFCQSRGYVAAAGLADETRAARQILKDYVNGKLLFYHLPPCDNYSSDLSEEDDEESGDDIEDSLACGNANTIKTLEYEGIMNHLDSFESTVGLKEVVPKNMRKAAVKETAMHKKHKKAPKKKDRSWRVGNDDSDGMPLVRGVAKPVSYGAARLAQTA
ncbi:hypothetical protein GOP47_0010176 [Adiantum capillus-veneris]|uniref:CP-type G domain-containing protein n=1 Tax=Adiantum capillus-veneris TaxID=13818 RepID=A0A9D4ZIG9_ADICA|nr:hypothetical protein GOP47_0010176 [Adiantum capillus-veneris]